MLHGHPVARQMEKWWRKHGQRHDHPEWISWLKTFNRLMEEKQKEWTSEHINELDGQKVFGMAGAAGCTREKALKLMFGPARDDSGSTMFTYWIGHVYEIAALATLVECGYDLIGTQSETTLGNVMTSFSDGEIKLLGTPTLVSIKSAAYKMSGQQKGKWIRRGFPELPFSGVSEAQPSWYAQIQAEMAGRGYKQALVIAVSKDVMKVFENDEYLGEKGNGSLVFYAELITAQPELAVTILETFENQMEYINRGEPGPALYLVGNEYKELEMASIQPSNIWGGPNQKITGKFNPCGGCSVVELCKQFRDATVE